MKIEDILLPTQNPVIDAKNFDLEKWRREMPMDYLIAVRILIESDNPVVKEEIFKRIVQIANLHVPDILYKYIPLKDSPSSNEKRFDILRNKQLFLPTVAALNDPYDCRAYYYNPEVLMKYDRLKSCGGRLIDDFSAFYRVASLTANGVQSMPMWAHYANNHAGFCVSYDMYDKYNLTLKSCTFPVQYTEHRLDITSIMEAQAKMLLRELKVQSAAGTKEIKIKDLTMVYLPCLLCNIKHSSWSYENEYRCTTGVNASGMPYVDAKAKAIFVGSRCEKENVKRLCKIGETLGIPVYQMDFDELAEEYQLSAKQLSV